MTELERQLLNALEQQSKEHEALYSALEKRLDAEQRNTKSLMDTVVDLSSNLTSLSGSVSRLEQRLSALNGR